MDSKPSLPYRHFITLVPADIDQLGHVNNEVYLRWLIEAAVAHSESLGFNFEQCYANDQAFVVKRHELDYRSSAKLGDALCVETWTEAAQGAKSIRHYQIIRVTDQKVMLQALTVWVFIQLSTGRPTAIPDAIAKLYKSETTKPQENS